VCAADGAIHAGLLFELPFDRRQVASCAAELASALRREQSIARDGWRRGSDSDVHPVELVVGIDPANPSEATLWGPGYLFEPGVRGGSEPFSEASLLELALRYLDDVTEGANVTS
jgi:hypothetical protein